MDLDRRAEGLLRIVSLAVLTLCSELMACGADSGGPLPCSEDAQCLPICEAACGSDPVSSATCDDFLLACVCECETTDASAER